ncbi:MAG: ABC transporter permease [Planctomycetota bacterium]|nr:ABC transporter permease [Planctomycetota bacterium]
MFTLIRLEILKLTRQKTFYVALFALLLFCLVFLVGFHTTDFQRFFSRQKWYRESKFDITPFLNGPLYAALAFGFVYYVLIPPFAALAGGHSIAGEAREGTLRMILSRPVSRLELGTAKFLAAFGYLVFIIFFVVGLSLLVGRSAMGGGSLLVYRGVFAESQGGGLPFWVVGEAEAVKRLFLAAALGSIAMSVVVTLAFALSSMFENPIVSIIGALCVFLVSWVIGNIEYYERLKPYLFTTHMNFWKDAFQAKIPWTETMRSMRWVAGYSVSFLTIGLAVFCRKDIKT